ncbi:DUF255 domain-containing protein [Roseiarcus sp.]|uniref:DUF255 domain-containing protein n=1 Tax=Roseiarcus sp. TaxID=1969460 RepID=UPI003C7358C4
MPSFIQKRNGSGSKRGGDGPQSLRRETSPYLLQHAHNPVHWRRWARPPWRMPS